MSDKSIHVCRGGSWGYALRHARSAYRGVVSGSRDEGIGIRLVEVINDPTPDPAASESDRVGRGGSWEWEYNPRLDFRIIDDPGFRSKTLGIRLVEVTDE